MVLGRDKLGVHDENIAWVPRQSADVEFDCICFIRSVYPLLEQGHHVFALPGGREHEVSLRRYYFGKPAVYAKTAAEGITPPPNRIMKPVNERLVES